MAEGGAVTQEVRFGTGGAASAVQLEGSWTEQDDCIEFAGGAPGSVFICFTAAQVEAVLSSASGAPIRIGVREDGPPLDREWCGRDCHDDPELGAAMEVAEHRVYHVIDRPDVETHELTFEVDAPGIRFHGLRFTD